MAVKKKSAAGRPVAARMTLADAMSAPEKAGSAQTRKTWARHGAPEPMFGVSFAEFAKLRKRIGADHDLARELWATGNADARILAAKVADPARTTVADLNGWVRQSSWTTTTAYIAQLAAETPHGRAQAEAWLAADRDPESTAAWVLVGELAMRDETLPDAWYAVRLAAIEEGIAAAPNLRRDVMNRALISIGCRNAELHKAALAAAKRIGKVVVDYGDTACKTPDAAAYIEKTWAYAAAKGAESPAAQERTREPIRLRC